MRAKRALAFAAAAVMCANCAAVASAEETKGFKASIGIASSDLSVQGWNSGIAVKEGQNTVTVTLPKDERGNIKKANGIGMLVIDLEDCYYDVGTVRVDELFIDGVDLYIEESAVVYGADDGTDGDNFRIELFSRFGETKNDAPFFAEAVTVKESVSVTFTVSRDGYSGGLKRVGGNVVEGKNGGSPKPLTDFEVSITTNEEDRTYPTSDEDSAASLPYSADGSSFTAELKRGIYDVTVSKEGYAAREFKAVKVGKKNPPELTDIDLRAFGDVNGDGRINVTDISIVAGYVKQVKNFSDDYQSAVADCNHDGAVNVTDVSSIAGAVKGVKQIK